MHPTLKEHIYPHEEGDLTMHERDAAPSIIQDLSFRETVQTLWGIRQNAPETFCNLYHRYGDVVRFNNGHRTYVVLYNPAHIQEHFHTANVETEKRSHDLRILADLIGDNLFTVAGNPQWQNWHDAAIPSFHHEKMKTYPGRIEEKIDKATAVWDTDIDRQGYYVLPDVSTFYRHLTMDIVSSTLFDYDLPDDQIPLMDKAVNDILTYYGTNLFNLGLPYRLLGKRPIRDALDQMDRYSRAVTERPDTNPADLPSSLVYRLREADEESLFENIRIFYLAGHETTANALTWMTRELDSPEGVSHVGRMREELRHAGISPDTPRVGDQLRRLKYPSALFKEAMRLYPPIVSITRRVMEDHTIGDIPLEADTTVIVSPYAVHRREDVWGENTDRYNPERFEQAPAPGSFIPFGGGPRICIGQPLALLEGQIVAAKIFNRYTIRIPEGSEVKPSLHAGTLRPDRQISAVITRSAP